MPYRKYSKLIVLVAFLFSLSINARMVIRSAFAQETAVEIAYTYEIKDTSAVDGDVLINTPDNGLVRASTPYDTRLFGIVQNKPVMVYRKVESTETPILRNGIASVNCATVNGKIKAGDYITSSDMQGKCQKATQSGYVLGVALNSLDENNGTVTEYSSSIAPDTKKNAYTGQVKVALRIEYAEISNSRSALRLFDYMNAALFKNIQDPEKFIQLFRYFAAVVIMIVSFTVGFFAFTRSIPKSIEAIGRNPLAQKSIIFSVAINIGFSLLIAVLGVVAAFMIIRV